MRRLLCLLAACALIASARAQTVTQTFALRSGWNSIWLEIEPTNAAIATVFAGLPLSSVWTYAAKDSTVEFIQQQTEAQFKEPGWLSYFPPSRPDFFLTTLISVHALRAYLVKVTNAATLSVTGIPAIKPASWVPDSFNLRGFPVNLNNLPTFATFFGPSAAHAGQPMYELQPNGQWQLVAASAKMKHGEAYWSYCQGASSFPGPLGIELEIGGGLNYGAVLIERVLRLVNNTADERAVCSSEFHGANNPLSHQIFASNRLSWVNLPSQYCTNVAEASATDLRLGLRRAAMTEDTYASILEVTDDLGTRYLLPVTAEKLLAARTGVDQPPNEGDPLAGLWVGTASITNVNEANSTQPLRLTSTRSAFELRLMVHVDRDSRVRLLKEVIQMWQNGTTTTDADGHIVPVLPGRFVLLTDDALIPQYRGASLRDGVPVGRRFSTLDFDFDGGTSNVLAMLGTFGINGTVQCTIILEPDFATNPFKHRFHPDHDNLDATYATFKEEAYQVTRSIELRFSATNPAAQGAASVTLDYGHNLIGGLYHETIGGLHRTNIVSEGPFQLVRVANASVLNK